MDTFNEVKLSDGRNVWVDMPLMELKGLVSLAKDGVFDSVLDASENYKSIEIKVSDIIVVL